MRLTNLIGYNMGITQHGIWYISCIQSHTCLALSFKHITQLYMYAS